MKNTRLLAPLAALLFTVGCQQIAENQIHFRQGNVLTPQQVAKLHTGQSKSEVISLLGSPVYDNTVELNRLIYVTHLRNGLKTETQRLILIFNNQQLVQILKEHSAT